MWQINPLTETYALLTTLIMETHSGCAWELLGGERVPICGSELKATKTR